MRGKGGADKKNSEFLINMYSAKLLILVYINFKSSLVNHNRFMLIFTGV